MSAKAIQNQTRSRITTVAALLSVGFAVIGARLVDVMVFERIEPAAPRVASAAPHHVRADIVDRNGVLLARDLPISDVYAKADALYDTDEAARLLSKTLGVNEVRLGIALASHHGYVAVKRGITPDEREAVMRLGLPGIEFQDGWRRFYPAGDAAARTIGHVDIDGHGVSGLEMGLDRTLHDSRAPVQLALDMRIQYVLANQIAQTAALFTTRAAGGIVMDVHTGEILASVSLAQADASDPKASRDRMTQDVYELGSIFKTFSFAQAVEDHNLRLDENFNVGAPYRIGGYAIRDSHHLGPVLSGAMVYAESSNIGTAQIAARFTPERQKAFLTGLGLLSPVRAELAKAAWPIYPSWWHGTETATISFGHGVSVSPLSFVAAAASVVNGGTRIVPTYLRHPQVQNGERVLTEDTSRTMRSLMRLVVTDGTGRKADVPGYFVGGKTGTAEKSNGHGYAHHELISSFCGVFPIDAPRYLVFVMFDEPHGTAQTGGFATAGYVAAPTAAAVIARIAPLLGVEKRDTVVASAATTAP